MFTNYKARPHWGKNMFLSLDKINQLYPNFDKWMRVYLLLNSDGTFDNEFTRKMGFEDFRTPESYRWKMNPSHAQVTYQQNHGQPLPTVSAQTQQQEITVAKVSHEDHEHVIATGSKIIRSEVISTQPKKSGDRVLNSGRSQYGKSHFTPIPLVKR